VDGQQIFHGFELDGDGVVDRQVQAQARIQVEAVVVER